MQITKIPALLIEQVVRTWRRRLIAGAVIVVFAIAAINEGISAARFALHAEVGPVWARVILTGAFLAIVGAAALLLLWRERREAAERAAKPFGGDERVSAIAEAIMLGYSLAQDFRRGGKSGAADEEPEARRPEAAAAETGDPSSARREP